MSDSRCMGTTRHGKPCQSRPLHGQQYCQHHMPGKAETKTITLLVAAVSRWERPFLSLRATVDSPLALAWDDELKDGDAQVLYWMGFALTKAMAQKCNSYPVVFECSIVRPLNLIMGYELPKDAQELEYLDRIRQLRKEFSEGVQFRWTRPDENHLTRRYQDKTAGMLMTPEEVASGDWLRQVCDSLRS